MEVAVADDDLSLAIGHALDLVAPLARNLDRGLNRLRARVHGEGHVVAQQVAQLLAERPQLVVAERARGKRGLFGLFHHGVDNARVAVALADRGVGAQAIHVALALDVGHPNAFGVFDHHVQRMIDVGDIGILEFDVSLGMHRLLL